MACPLPGNSLASAPGQAKKAHCPPSSKASFQGKPHHSALQRSLRQATLLSSLLAHVSRKLLRQVISNLDEVEDTVRRALPAGSTVLRASVDGMSLREQFRLVSGATAMVAFEGGGLDLALLSPRGLAVVILGRDRGVPFPDGCAKSVNGSLASPAKEAKETKEDDMVGTAFDPFTHRPFFEALEGIACARMVETRVGSSTFPASNGGILTGSSVHADANAVAAALQEALRDSACEIANAPLGSNQGG